MEIAAHARPLRAPFPWFGGKSRAASLIWAGLGDVSNYVEPFMGSLAVLLGRPTAPHIETVNDRDAYLANWWRAVQHDPAAVAAHADWPVNEADLHARHLWLVQQEGFRERMLTDPEFYDVKIAGWWVWGLSCWIGGGWCDPAKATRRRPRADGWSDHGVHQKRPVVAGDRDGNGIHRKVPRIDGQEGAGLHGYQTGPSRQLPLSDGTNPGCGSSRDIDLSAWFAQLCARLRRTRVVCGDWTRVLTPTVLRSHGVTGVVLDPPYAHEAEGKSRDGDLYVHDAPTISADARAWALDHGDDPSLRIVLCGYEGEHPMPASWRCEAWKAGGGYSNQRKGGTNDNARRERLWFSPHCLRPEGARHEDLPLFGGTR